MAVNLPLPQAADLKPVRGVQLGWAEAGIRKADRKDVLVVTVPEGTAVAGVFTRNRFCAAPVQVCREHLAAGTGIRALVVNTGNANAGTGEPGLAAARATCDALAGQLGISPQQILPFSTGVILEPLPVARLVAGLPQALGRLAEDHWLQAAEAIMTTDTQPKAASRTVVLGGKTVTLTGISKGAGMIRPNMATMLGFIATDAAVAQPVLQQLVTHAADHSFNSITIDGERVYERPSEDASGAPQDTDTPPESSQAGVEEGQYGDGGHFDEEDHQQPRQPQAPQQRAAQPVAQAPRAQQATRPSFYGARQGSRQSMQA